MESVGVIVGYRTDVDPSVLPGIPYLVEARLQDAEGMPIHPEAESAMRLPGGRMLFTVRVQSHGLVELDAWCAEHDLLDTRISPIVASAPGHQPTMRLEGIRVRCHHCRKAIHGEAVTDRLRGRTHVFCCRLCKEAFAGRLAELADS